MREDKLIERITIRFTSEELKGFKDWAQEENERKVSALLRRILITNLKKRRARSTEPIDCRQIP